MNFFFLSSFWKRGGWVFGLALVIIVIVIFFFFFYSFSRKHFLFFISLGVFGDVLLPTEDTELSMMHPSPAHETC
jgi:hypothetical protein